MRIAISGGPCSGKTTLLNYLKQCSFMKEYSFIDEVATDLLKSGFEIDDQCKDSRLNFQREIYRKQCSYEKEKNNLFVVDRTLAEGAVYCADIFEFGKEVGGYFSNYDLVIYLSHLDQDQYDLHRNIFRLEEYKKAAILSEKTRKLLHLIYKDRVIEVHRSSMEDKISVASQLIRKVIEVYGSSKLHYSHAIFLEER
ncbi:ATP-binding protein [bacterium]|nr:ATP-binding protein [bacterium]